MIIDNRYIPLYHVFPEAYYHCASNPIQLNLRSIVIPRSKELAQFKFVELFSNSTVHLY